MIATKLYLILTSIKEKFILNLFFFLVLFIFQNKVHTQDDGLEKIITPSCNEAIANYIKEFTPVFLALHSDMSKYRFLYTMNLFTLNSYSNSKFSVQDKIKSLKNDIKIFQKSENSKYLKQFEALSNLSSPKHLQNDELANFVDLIVVLMKDKNSNLYRDAMANSGKNPEDFQKEWDSYGLKEIDSKTINLMHDLYINDPSTDKARLLVATEYDRDILKRQNLKLEDLSLFRQLQNQITSGKASKSNQIGLNAKKNLSLDINSDGLISFEEVDKRFQEQYLDVMKNNKSCIKIFGEDKECLPFNGILPSLYSVFNSFEINPSNYDFKNNKISSLSNPNIEIKKEYMLYKGVRANCYLGFGDDKMPTIDLNHLSESEEYYVVYFDQLPDPKKFQQMFQGQKSEFRNLKEEEIDNYFQKNNITGSIHITNNLINAKNKTKIQLDHGTDDLEKNTERFCSFDKGELKVPTNNSANFMLVSKYGNNPISFNNCSKKTKHPDLKNPISLYYQYEKQVASAQAHVDLSKQYIASNQENIKLANDIGILKAKEVAEVIGYNNAEAENHTNLAENDLSQAMKTHNEYLISSKTKEGKQLESNGSQIDPTKIENTKSEINKNTENLKKIKDQSVDITFENPPVDNKKYSTPQRLVINSDNETVFSVGTDGKIQPLVVYQSRTNEVISPLEAGPKLNIMPVAIDDQYGINYENNTTYASETNNINSKANNLEKIKAYFKSPLAGNYHCNQYSVLDKKSKTITVFGIDGNKIESVVAHIGSNPNDMNLSWKNEKLDLTNESSTPAGIFNVGKNRSDKTFYKNKYAKYNFNFLPLSNAKSTETVFSIHQTAIENPRVIDNGTINLSENDFLKMLPYLENCQLLVLPNEPGGEFTIKNDMLKFYYNDNSKHSSSDYNITPASSGSEYRPIIISGATTTLMIKASKTLEDEKRTLMDLYDLSSQEYDDLAILTLVTLDLECEGGDGIKYNVKKALDYLPDGVTKAGKSIIRGKNTFNEKLSKGCGQVKNPPKKIAEHYKLNKVSYDVNENTLMTFGALADANEEFKSIRSYWKKTNCALLQYQPQSDILRFIYKGGKYNSQNLNQTIKEKLRNCEINTEETITSANLKSKESQNQQNSPPNLKVPSYGEMAFGYEESKGAAKISPTLATVKQKRKKFTIFASLPGPTVMVTSGNTYKAVDVNGKTIIPEKYSQIRSVEPANVSNYKNEYSYYDAILPTNLCDRYETKYDAKSKSYSRKIIQQGILINSVCEYEPSKISSYFNETKNKVILTLSNKLDETLDAKNIPHQNEILNNRSIRLDSKKIVFIKDKCYEVDSSNRILKSGVKLSDSYCAFTKAEIASYYEERPLTIQVHYNQNSISYVDQKSLVLPTLSIHRRNEWDDSNPGFFTKTEPINLSKLESKSKTESLSYKFIIIHHSDNDFSSDKFSINKLKHSMIAGRGMGDIAYNFIISNENSADNIYEGRSLQFKAAAVTNDHIKTIHKNLNVNSIHIVVIGNFDLKKPSELQIKSLSNLINDLRVRYNIRQVKYHGDPDIDKTNCPGKLFPKNNF